MTDTVTVFVRTAGGAKFFPRTFEGNIRVYAGEVPQVHADAYNAAGWVRFNEVPVQPAPTIDTGDTTT